MLSCWVLRSFLASEKAKSTSSICSVASEQSGFKTHCSASIWELIFRPSMNPIFVMWVSLSCELGASYKLIAVCHTDVDFLGAVGV